MSEATEKPHVLKIENMTSHYGPVKVLDDINLTINQREILVVMGHSGCGKSTLFRHILGLKQPTSGSIEVLGKQLTTLSKKELYELRKHIGVAFQNGALFSSLNVLENVELPLREHTELDDNTIRIMTRMKLEQMNLADFEELMPSELLGGMLKRAGLARAVVMDPKLLFFDEPSAGLDPITSAELDQLILQLRDALNMTIIIVTHELESAFSVADRITVMDKGKQILTGTKEEIKASTDPRIANMLARKARDEDIDGDAYLDRLMEAQRVK